MMMWTFPNEALAIDDDVRIGSAVRCAAEVTVTFRETVHITVIMSLPLSPVAPPIAAGQHA